MTTATAIATTQKTADVPATSAVRPGPAPQTVIVPTAQTAETSRILTSAGGRGRAPPYGGLRALQTARHLPCRIIPR